MVRTFELIKAIGIFLSRKMTEYIQKGPKSAMMKYRKKGKLELYTGLKFKKMEDDPKEQVDTVSSNDLSYAKELNFDKATPNTRRELINDIKNGHAHMFEEDKYETFGAPEPDLNIKEEPFGEIDHNGIFYEEPGNHTMVNKKNQNFYENGNDLSLGKLNGRNRVSVSHKLPGL